ncbi:MAG: glycosyltransferase family 4 protein [bacterium]|nr:glycosyltransferase family 4 protein [bacterium]
MVICSPQLGLAPDSVLGGEVFDRQILLGLAKHGIKVEIILPKSKPHDRNIKNWHFSYLPISHFPAILGNILVIPYLFKVHYEAKFSILRIHQPQFLGLGALIFKIFNPKVKTLAIFHQFREANFMFLSHLVNKSWDFVIADSYSVKRKLIKAYNIKPAKIEVVHNGVPSYLSPTSKNNFLEKSLKIQNKVVWMYMGFFDYRKNPIFLLDVLAKFKESDSIILIFWGKGPLEGKIRSRAKELGILNRIRIQKPVFGKEKNKIHNLADIFVHPSTDEGFALAPLEAMSCAKPVVMTDSYSAREAVDDSTNGFLCRQNDPDDWKKKLSILSSSRSKRIQMGKAALLKVKKEFQWDISVRKHIRVFKYLSE